MTFSAVVNNEFASNRGTIPDDHDLFGGLDITPASALAWPAGYQPLSNAVEARRLHAEGFKLCRLAPFVKRPEGNAWNAHPVEQIEDGVNYGLILAASGLCSIDPDNVEPAREGLARCGFDLEALMKSGVRTTSTRPGSGGRAIFRADPRLRKIVFKSRSLGTILELRAHDANLQDTLAPLSYFTIKTNAAGNPTDVKGPYEHHYHGSKRVDDADELPPAFLTWWVRLSTDLDFRHEQERLFVGEAVQVSVSCGGVLAFESELRGRYNETHDVESVLLRHGYQDCGRGRYSAPNATGGPGIRAIPGRDDLWQSDHASDPLSGTFDAWTAFVVLDHSGDQDTAELAYGDVLRALALDGFEEVDESDPVEPANPSRFALMTADDLARLMPLRWRVKRVLPYTGIGAIFGASGSGKSFLALDLLAAVAEGRAWYGNQSKATRGILVALEGEHGTAARAAAWSKHHLRPMPAGVRFITSPLHLGKPQDVADLAAAVSSFADDAPVIVIDTLAQAAPGLDENSGKDMSIVISAVKTLQRKTGGLVLLVHHTGKDAARGPRGHSSLFAALDVAVEVTRDGSRRTWSLAKSKDSTDDVSHAFALESVTLGVDEDGEPVTSCVAVPDTTTPAGSNYPTHALTTVERKVYYALIGYARQHGDNDGLQVAVSLEGWRKAYYDSAFDVKQDTKKRNFGRAKTKLLDLGLVREDAPNIVIDAENPDFAAEDLF